jgi:MoaA/NifB/PqqE/SkfB family radical SAM enzyme
MCWRTGITDKHFADIEDSILGKLENVLVGATDIGWWGDGEFFCYSDMDKLFGLMKKYPKASHKFSTNGQLLSRYIYQLSECNIGEIIISIDGATEETLSRIRVGCHLRNIVDGVIELFRVFDYKNKKRPIILFSFIAMRSNIHELPDLVRLAGSLQVPIVFVQRLKVNQDTLLPEILDDIEERDFFNTAKKIANEVGVTLKHELGGLIDVS